MDSRIILTQADFSNNNIGRYTIFSDLTKKVLTKQTQYNEDDEEAIALNTFLNNLVLQGFIGGNSPLLDDLIIPGLASSHSELLYNIASLDENGYPTNMMTSEETNASESLRTYRPVINNSKIVAVKRYCDSNMNVSDNNLQSRLLNNSFTKRQSNNTSYKSFSIVLYQHNILAGSAVYFCNNGGTFNIRHNKTTYQSGSTTLVEVNYDALGEFNALSYNAENTRFEITIDNSSINGETGTAPTYSSNYNKYEIGAFNYNNKPETSLIAIGSYLTQEQIALLKYYSDTFLTAIHANV